jgi:hypothetical protein
MARRLLLRSAGGATMNRFASRLLPAALLVLLAAAPLQAAGLSAQDKNTINTLLDRLSKDKRLHFVRLDKTYDAATAATYLRFKWHQNESKVHNVQDFINLSATGGKNGEVTYYVQYPDGKRRPARDVLQEAVNDILHPAPAKK